MKIYQHLQEFASCQSPPPGVEHFISQWSIGSWSLGEYLQLPRLIPVSDRRSSKTCLQALSLSRQLLDGVDFLHSRLEVAHMDIKPDNLVLDVGHGTRFTLKIIDFNISIMHANRMVAGVRGTKGYMAPEVEDCSRYRPFLADRYSCGVCIEVFLRPGRKIRHVERCCFSYSDFASFALKLRNWNPSKRPALTECPQLQFTPSSAPSGMKSCNHLSEQPHSHHLWAH